MEKITVSRRVIALFMCVIMIFGILPLFVMNTQAAGKLPLFGDVDRDGVVANTDIASLVRYLSGWGEDIDTKAADFDGNGKINNRDAIMLILKKVEERITLPSEPELTSSAVGYVSYGDTSGLCSSDNTNDGLTDKTSKHSWGAVYDDGVMSLMSDGGTVVSTGRGMIGKDYTFEKMSSPVYITAKYGLENYRDNSIVNSAGTGSGTQRGSFILGDSAVTVSFAGDYIFNNIDIFTRNKTGGATISVLLGAKVVFGSSTRITDMTASSNHEGNKKPTLNVEAGGYVYLYTLGFDSYTGAGTIVLSDPVIASGRATPQLFANFRGKVVDSLGREVVTPLQGYGVTIAPAEPAVTGEAVGYVSHGSTSGLCTSSDKNNDGLTDTTSKYNWGPLTGQGVMSLMTEGGTVVSTGRGMFGVDYTFKKTTTPVLITAVYGERDYRDGSIVNEAGTGNGTQKGTFILGDKAVTVSFEGEYIIDNIDIFTRNKTGGATISILSGARVVFGEGANITDMTASSNHVENKAPTLNVEAGACVYLYTFGFDSYTGEGTVVLTPELVSTGRITEADFANFSGEVIYADGSTAFENIVGESIDSIPTVALEHGAVYKITADSSGNVMTAENFGYENMGSVKLSAYERDLSQMWRAQANSDGTYTLKNMVNGSALYFGDTAQINELPSLALCVYTADDISKGWKLHSADGTLSGVVLANAYTSLTACVTESNGTAYAASRVYASYACDTWSFEKVSDGNGEYPEILVLSGDYMGSSSCPEILYYDGVYYNYNMTGPIALKTSTDLITWTRHQDKYALTERPTWLEGVSGTEAIWAPGAYKIGDRYYLYYCTSSSGSRNSGIGVAVSDNPANNDWQDLGLVLRSYDPTDSFNAIDPNVFIDDDGRAYLIYGSYWEGIFMRELNTETGMLSETNTTVYHLAKGAPNIEAPYLVKRGNYYYLFVAKGGLSAGTYYWAVGRSTSLTGTFRDKDGVSMLSDGGTRLTEWKDGLVGIGHAQCFFDTDGTTYMVSEAWQYRNTDGTSQIQLHISKMVWTEDGWPVTALDPDVLSALGE